MMAVMTFLLPCSLCDTFLYVFLVLLYYSAVVMEWMVCRLMDWGRDFSSADKNRPGNPGPPFGVVSADRDSMISQILP
jgi:hypothetical protein